MNAQQKEAVTSDKKHLLVFAGPGTGKTRVITHRIAYMIGQHGVDPESILAITFTNKAAAEMKYRLERLLTQGALAKPWVGTFHSFANWLLHRHWSDAKLPKDFVIYDMDDQKSLLREILNERELPPNRAGVFLEAIQRLKDDLMDSHSYAIHAGVSTNPYRDSIAKVYAAYQTALRQRGALDFGDLMLEAVNLLRDVPEVATKYQERFTNLFVDEYQDINKAQYSFIRAMVAPATYLTAVADDDQCIYEWRQANPRYTLDFTKEFPGAGTITLTQNYRSTPEIIAPAARLIEKNENRQKKELLATRPQGTPPRIVACD
ncbi:MAG: ATP-dependent helicase, partial [Elusimicrobiota bacterium]